MMSSCVHKPDLFWYFSGLQFSHLFFFHKYYSIWRAKQGGLVSEGWTGLSVGRRSSSSCNNHSTALQFVLPGKHKLDIVAPIQQAFWWPHKIILTAVESKWKGVGGDDWDFLGMSLYIRPWLCADGPADGIILWKIQWHTVEMFSIHYVYTCIYFYFSGSLTEFESRIWLCYTTEHGNLSDSKLPKVWWSHGSKNVAQTLVW